jgi:hypothetical protein
VVAYVAQRPRAAWARAGAFLAAGGVGAGLALLLTAYPIWFQFNGPQSYRGLQGGVFHGWGEDLAAFVTFARDTVAGDEAVEKTIGLTEQNTWFGWPLVLSGGGPGALDAARCRRILAVLVVVFTVAAIGPKVRFDGVETAIDGPWAYIPDDLPLVEMMMPTRLTLVVAGAVGVLLALAWDAVARSGVRGPVPAPRTAPDDAAPAQAARARKRWLRPVGYAAISLAVLPLFPRPLPAQHVDAPPTFITSGAWRPYVPAGRTLVPVPVPSNVHGLPTLRWSALTGHRFPVPGGYFIGPGPNGRGLAPEPADQQPDLLHPGGHRGAGAHRGEPARCRAALLAASVVVLGARPREAVLRSW